MDTIVEKEQCDVTEREKLAEVLLKLVKVKIKDSSLSSIVTKMRIAACIRNF